MSLDRNPVVSYVDVETAAELAAACEERFADSELLLMAAAVADYRPTEVAGTKLKKDAERLELALERTDDVLAALAARRRPDQTIVGFAAEHGAGLEGARDKLARKGLDLIVLNDISRPDIGFDAPDNEVTIVTATGEEHVPRAGKGEVAGAILDAIQNILNPEEYNRGDGAARAARSRRPG